MDHAGPVGVHPRPAGADGGRCDGRGGRVVAGFLAATIRGADPFGAARIGNAVAASCVTAIGASTAIRRFEDYPQIRNRAGRGQTR